MIEVLFLFGNFLSGFFFQRIAQTNLFMGSYPLFEMDIQKLKNAGVNAVFDIKDQYDNAQRGIDTGKMMQFYRNNGINVVACVPVTDEDPEDYADDLFEAAKVLHDLIDVKGHKVFLHDTTGVSRAPTLYLVYLSLFKKSNLPLNDMARELKKQYPVSTPNMKMIEQVLDFNQSFIDGQKPKVKVEKKDNSANLKNMDEMDRLRHQLQNAKDEADAIRRKRLQEAEAEKQRLQRAKHEHDEMLR